MIQHTCPNCGAHLEVPEQYAGQPIKCGGCGGTIQCPMGDTPPSIPSMPPQPRQAYAPPPAQPLLSESSNTQAIIALVLGILSFVLCLGPLGSIPAVILGHLSLSKIKNGHMPASARGMAVAGLVIGYINIAIMLVFMLLLPALARSREAARRRPSPIMVEDALSRAREAARRSSCQNNLKQMGLVYKMFANESKGMVFPHLSATPGQLMSAKSEIYPEYLTDPVILICPSMPDYDTWSAKHDAAIDDECYFYLGYAVCDESDVAVFCAAYKERMAKGEPLDGDLTVPDGKGSLGGNIIYRLKEGVERFFITDINNPAGAAMVQSKIPILIERPGNHVPTGGNVLFMDGHVEFIRYPGAWPMTPQTVTELQELDAMEK